MTNPAETLLRVYGSASLNQIAKTYSIPADGAFDALTERFKDKPARKKIVDSLPEISRGFLAFMNDVGRRLRGERLKKRWFLHGYDDFDDCIEPLIRLGIVVVGNTAAREPVSLDTVYDQGLLQQWIQINPGFEDLAGDPPPPREVVQAIQDVTTVEVDRRTLVVEFNILNVLHYVERNQIRLNRDGSPHRSDLKSLAPTIIDRAGVPGRADSAPDPLNVFGWDVLSFLLSVAAALGLIQRKGDILRATTQGRDYFLKPLAERLPIITRAIEQQLAWSELDSARWFESGEPPVTGQGDGGFQEVGGHAEKLAGPRGSVFAALRRLNPSDWFDVEETAQTITTLENQYLSSALPIPTGDEISPGVFVRSVITICLPHAGGAQLGRGSDGKLRARLTDIGRAMLGMEGAPEEPSGKSSILVEPNYEITAFLEVTPLRLLYNLSRFAELVHTGEQVVRYRLSGESVQWGYARGYTAEKITTILSDFSSRPIPPAVRFALQDWERLHRRVTVYVHGDMVAAGEKNDPEIIQQSVQFLFDGQPDQVEPVDMIHTFVVTGNVEKIARALTAENLRIIDYEGPVVPTLTWVDDQRLKAPTGEVDIRTLSRLQRVADHQDDDVYRILPSRVRHAYGEEDGYQQLIDMLRPAIVGGLTAERELALKKLLGKPAEAKIETMEVLVVGTDEDGDRVARLEKLNDFIIERLGPRTFRVTPGSGAKLTSVLKAHGIAVDARKG